MVRRIEVVPYNPRWPILFEEEADRIASIFGHEVVAIQHIGSTAIPNISAKSIIDVLVEVHNIERIDDFNETLHQLGYLPKGEFGIAGRRFIIRGDEINRTHHIHIFQTGHPDIGRHLNFRDYMIAHTEEARDYSRLKEELARKCATDIESYMTGKDEFIKEIDRKTKAWKDNTS